MPLIHISFALGSARVKPCLTWNSTFAAGMTGKKCDGNLRAYQLAAEDFVAYYAFGGVSCVDD
jgi:hypothetical protein